MTRCFFFLPPELTPPLDGPTADGTDVPSVTYDYTAIETAERTTAECVAGEQGVGGDDGDGGRGGR